MKSINTFITEKLNISKNNKYNNIIKYYPQTRDELIKCIESHFDEDNGDLSDIDITNVENISSIFRKLFYPKYRNITEINVTGWNTSNVTHMGRLFFNCFKLKKIHGIEDWDVSEVLDMRSMFYNCENLDIDISKWKINGKCKIEKMFYGSSPNIKIPHNIKI